VYLYCNIGVAQTAQQLYFTTSPAFIRKGERFVTSALLGH